MVITDASSVSSRESRNRSDELERTFATMTPRPSRRRMPTSVAVIGLPESDESTERLRNYFSARCRSGGGEIKHCYWDKQHYAFIIIFHSNEG